jgi:hypothetical protein
MLFEHAAQVARNDSAESMDWDAEPYALGFYEAMGGVVIGETPSAAEPGRRLPRMRLDLRPSRAPQRGGAYGDRAG